MRKNASIDMFGSNEDDLDNNYKIIILIDSMIGPNFSTVPQTGLDWIRLARIGPNSTDWSHYTIF